MTGYEASGSQHKAVPQKKHGDMFPTPKWRDLWAALLFYVHLGVFVGISVYALNAASHLQRDPTDDINWDGADLRFAGISLLAAITTSIGMTALAMLLMYRAPGTSLHVSFLVSIAVNAGMAVWFFLQGSLWGGIIMAVMGVMSAIFYAVFRSRIPFSAILLRVVMDCFGEFPSMVVVAGGSIAVSILYISYFVSTVGALGLLYNERKDGSTTWMLIYSAFSMFWTSQVLGNVVQTSIAGVYATYYFVHGTGQAIVNPTWNALKRAMTYSFGSICFGSLIVALIQTVRFLLRSVTDRGSIAGAIADCLLGMIEGLVEYFNYYAYTQIAIYGKSYIEAAKDTWHLVKTRGVDAIVNDNLIGTCLGMFGLAIALTSGFVVYLMAALIYSKPFETAIAAALVCGIGALVIPAVAFQVIGAGATTTFVCLAEDPEALRRTKPQLYDTIMQKYSLIAI